ncbi:hypothetical protein Sango_0327500 [Sesamum angolense]|uniref:Pentatricopeptide repeat-containing protein n=1 Tax=Sesamum angolense TaxID=2727404 RepID=A0AAE2C3L1_9LAMI|nr:hypothetical protein Sango_0327500 [Sesamum angolense]
MDVAPYTVLIGAYLKAGNVKKAMNLWRELLELGLVPDSRAYSAMIDGLCRCNFINIAKGIFTKMRTHGHTPTSFDYNNLMAALCQESSLEQARAMFRDMVNGLMEEAKSIFERMTKSGFPPSVFVYDSLLKGFKAEGKTEEILNLLHKMADAGVLLDAELTSTILTLAALSWSVEHEHFEGIQATTTMAMKLCYRLLRPTGLSELEC